MKNIIICKLPLSKVNKKDVCVGCHTSPHKDSERYMLFNEDAYYPGFYDPTVKTKYLITVCRRCCASLDFLCRCESAGEFDCVCIHINLHVLDIKRHIKLYAEAYME